MRANWPREKLAMSFFQGNSGRSSQDARRRSVDWVCQRGEDREKDGQALPGDSPCYYKIDKQLEEQEQETRQLSQYSRCALHYGVMTDVFQVPLASRKVAYELLLYLEAWAFYSEPLFDLLICLVYIPCCKPLRLQVGRKTASERFQD